MKPVIALAAVMVVLAASGTAWAGRCLDIPSSRIVWCDDFDNYCTANNPDHPWPGYPPVPDTVCARDRSAVPDESFFCASMHWPNVFFEGCDCSRYHPGDPTCYERPDGTAETPNALQVVDCTYCNYYDVPPTSPMMIYFQRWSASQYHEFDMTPVISARHPGMNAVNGTDAKPLILKLCFRNCFGNSFLLNRNPFYIELRLGDDRAPTDYVWSASQGAPPWCNCANLHPNAKCVSNVCDSGPLAGQGCTKDSECSRPCGEGEQSTCQDGYQDMWGQACSQDSECGGEWVYPVVVQQEQHGSRILTPHPQPPWPVHASLAVGYLGQLDNGATYGYPAVEHLCTFDGEVWNDIHGGRYPGQVNDFGGPNLYAWVTVEIRTNDYVLKMWDTADPNGPPTSSATIPRAYTGPFNKVAIGAGASCELKSENSNDWTCKDGAQRRPWDYPYPQNRVYTTSGDGWGRHTWMTGWMDTPVLYDGEYVHVTFTGACCKQGNCTEVLESECQAMGGTFQGMGTPCASDTCCPWPFADADRDGDVDLGDFAELQRCFTTGGAGTVPGCNCWDRNGDTQVDAIELEAFLHCSTGPGVAWDPDLTPSCVP